MVGETGATVVDFGITKGADPRHDITAVHTIIGSPPYMAPECFIGSFSPQSDLYSLGCVIHEMVTGRPPFGGPGFQELALRHRRDPPPSLHRGRTGVPTALEDLVAYLLAKDPADRPADAHQVYDALDDIYDRHLGDRAPRRGRNVNTRLSVDAARADTRMPITIPWAIPCPQCTTPDSGDPPRSDCPVCDGTGWFRKMRDITILLPATIRDGQRLRIRGWGGPGINGGDHGDLHITLLLRQPAEATPPEDAPTATANRDRSAPPRQPTKPPRPQPFRRRTTNLPTPPHAVARTARRR
jgi:serine/threonine protein kinase